jgi:RNA polymerase sigma-70 factor, ECF subfamily
VENGARPPVEPTSEALAARVAQGDVAAFAQLYDRYARPVYALAAQMLGAADAEEALQAVFLRLWQSAGKFDPARGSFGGWFMAVARHLVLDELRRRGQRQRLAAVGEVERLLGEAADPAVDVEEQVSLREQGDAVLRALRRLPEEQRRVLVLAYFGDLSQSAIARQLGLPLGTVKKRIRLGLRKLHAALARQEVSAEEPATTPTTPAGLE